MIAERQLAGGPGAGLQGARVLAAGSLAMVITTLVSLRLLTSNVVSNDTLVVSEVLSGANDKVALAGVSVLFDVESIEAKGSFAKAIGELPGRHAESVRLDCLVRVGNWRATWRWRVVY